MKQSAGALLYRRAGGTIEVLLVHPSGAYNRKAPWSLPKGVPDEGEGLEASARRETREETGVEPRDLADLGHVDYVKSKKRVYCFAGEVPSDAQPRCASWEIDRAEFVALERARDLIHPDQRVFLDRLTERLG